MGLKIQNLENMLDIEGGGGIAIPYIGYVEVQLQIPEIKNYKEDALMMVMNNSRSTICTKYKVPFAIGTIHIHAALKKMTKDEWKNMTQSWRSVALPACTSKASGIENFSLDSVGGDVKVHKTTILPPFSTTFVKGRSSVKGHYKRVNTTTEHSDRITNRNIATVRSYSFIKPSSNKVAVGVRNLTSKQIVLKAGTIIGKIEAANEVPPMLVPKPEIAETDMESILEQLSNKERLTMILDLNSSAISPEKCKLTQEEIDLLMSKLDLSGIKDWKPEEQKEAKELILEYGSLFALKDMDLGRMDNMKHSIKLDDYAPFKERYRCIPPHQYEEVKQHLKEMLEIGAISKSKSPWASVVVLVRKKDGSLRFCIDLRKLNARTVKDAYSLPRTEETIDSFNGA